MSFDKSIFIYQKSVNGKMKLRENTIFSVPQKSILLLTVQPIHLLHCIANERRKINEIYIIRSVETAFQWLSSRLAKSKIHLKLYREKKSEVIMSC